MNDILIAIPTKNRADILPLPLYSLFQQTHKDFDVFIYDQSDEPITENYIVRQMFDLLQLHGDINVIHKRSMKDRSLTQARQFLLHYTKQKSYKYLLMLDDDVALQPDCLEKLYKEIKNSKDIIYVEAIAMDVNNALRHSDYDVDVHTSTDQFNRWQVNHHYYDVKFEIDRTSTTGGFHYLIDMQKVDEAMFNNVIYQLGKLIGMPCEDIMLLYHLTSGKFKGRLITNALVYHFPNTAQPRDWYNVTRKIQQRISEKGEV